jgi:hypothetical protein
VLFFQIRSGNSSRARIRNRNTSEIRRFMQDMIEDDAPDRILTFLKRTDHQIDGYITQQIGPYPGNKNVLLFTNCITKIISKIKVLFKRENLNHHYSHLITNLFIYR